MSKPRNRNKYCIVPKCLNSTINTPDKLFFHVPKGELRKKWCEMMGINLSEKYTCYCCEDHFDVENDIYNYWELKYKLHGGKKLMLKKGVLPCRSLNNIEKVSLPEKNGDMEKQELEVITFYINEDTTDDENDQPNRKKSRLKIIESPDFKVKEGVIDLCSADQEISDEELESYVVEFEYDSDSSGVCEILD